MIEQLLIADCRLLIDGRLSDCQLRNHQ